MAITITPVKTSAFDATLLTSEQANFVVNITHASGLSLLLQCRTPRNGPQCDLVLDATVATLAGK